ncbi:hypothetical protein CYMTET_55770 [Cymbomonas tetramitiformis]|uniref:Uncharacterized protein n=1 Tax=Cymbomonas tetramitiformis TaxID=36881 RepID=A0AAE0EMN0_9CHLO|nr:hypothetical protein CYMTET_55770 [Cymbomonas tetramitiformis]
MTIIATDGKPAAPGDKTKLIGSNHMTTVEGLTSQMIADLARLKGREEVQTLMGALKRVERGVYMLDNNIIHIRGGRLTIRVGGGFMTLSEYMLSKCATRINGEPGTGEL